MIVLSNRYKLPPPQSCDTYMIALHLMKHCPLFLTLANHTPTLTYIHFNFMQELKEEFESCAINSRIKVQPIAIIPKDRE